MSLAVAPGDVIAGKYRVEGVLGRGAMGFVVSATHLGLGSRVAIKLLHREMLRSPEAVTRFAREARAAAALASDHVTRVLDVGTTENGVPFMVMEHLQGETLDAIVSHGTLSVADAVTFALHVCDALTEAHAAGITHHDLKPQNIFIVQKASGQRMAKVLDFGISKIENAAITGDSRDLTLTGALVGTPSFMSPEQLKVNVVGPTSDVWALGATFYHALTKQLPYQTETFYELNAKMATEEPTPITAWRRDLPPGLVDVFAGCLRRDPAQRYTVATIIARLEEVKLALAQPSMRESYNSRLVPTEVSIEPAPPSVVKRRRGIALGAATGFLLAVPIGFLLTRKPPVEIPPATIDSAGQLGPASGVSVASGRDKPPAISSAPIFVDAAPTASASPTIGPASIAVDAGEAAGDPGGSPGGAGMSGAPRDAGARPVRPPRPKPGGKPVLTHER